MVGIFAVDGDAGVALLDDLAFEAVEGAVVRQGEHFGAGGHDLFGFGLAERYDAFQDAFVVAFVHFVRGHFERLGEVVYRKGGFAFVGEQFFQSSVQQDERSAENAGEAYRDAEWGGGQSG